ncbi:hypothetical protein [Synechococcus phage MA10]
MAYQDSFREPAYYYEKINRLVDFYGSKGYVNLVHDWERKLTKVADYPDLRSLAKRASDVYYSLQQEVHQ